MCPGHTAGGLAGTSLARSPRPLTPEGLWARGPSQALEAWLATCPTTCPTPGSPTIAPVPARNYTEGASWGLSWGEVSTCSLEDP